MIGDLLSVIKEMFLFLKSNPDVGIKVVGVIGVLIVIRKLIKSDKVQGWIKVTGRTIGVSLSKLLIARFGQTIGLWIENIIIDIKISLVNFLDTLVEGLQSDNDKRAAAIEVSKAKKHAKGNLKLSKVKNKIK